MIRICYEEYIEKNNKNKCKNKGEGQKGERKISKRKKKIIAISENEKGRAKMRNI